MLEGLVTDEWTVFESNEPVLDEIRGRTGLRTAYYVDTRISNIDRVWVTFVSPSLETVIPCSRRLYEKSLENVFFCLTARGIRLDDAVRRLVLALEGGAYLIGWTTFNLYMTVPSFSGLDELVMKPDLAN